jgi:hypothetical protein
MLLAVETPDAPSAMKLVQRLIEVHGGEAVSMTPNGQEVRVDAREDANRTVGETLNTVQAWLADLALDQARIRCDGRTYSMQRLGRERSSRKRRSARVKHSEGKSSR